MGAAGHAMMPLQAFPSIWVIYVYGRAGSLVAFGVHPNEAAVREQETMLRQEGLHPSHRIEVVQYVPFASGDA